VLRVSEPVTDVAIRTPSPPLRACVDRYVGYHFDGFPPGIHRGLPSRHLKFIVSLGAPIELASMPDPAQPPASYAALAGGLHGRAATIVHDGTQYGVSVELTPLGARALLGLPAGALASTVVPIEDLLGQRTAELIDRLASADRWEARFAALDRVLLDGLQDARDVVPEVAWAWRRLVRTGGTVDITGLAGEVGWSRRHFTEQFRSELGVPPKVAARVLRFERARQMLGSAGHGGLARVAATCGYYDQSHLTREWRDLAGCTPSTWLAEELPSVQDAIDVDGAR
jgi:AraC-like DNA-binding protein